MCTLEKKSLLMIFNLPNYLHQHAGNYLTHFGEMVALWLFPVNFLVKKKKRKETKTQEIYLVFIFHPGLYYIIILGSSFELK